MTADWAMAMTYQPHPAFTQLFRAFTSAPDSIGAGLTDLMESQSSSAPLLVSSASDIALFPGAGAPPGMESFRKSTRGFVELTAVSHVPLSLAYIARMRELDPQRSQWRLRLQGLMRDAHGAAEVNSVALWRDHVALRAFSGIERKVANLVTYTLKASIEYMEAALSNPRLLEFENLRGHYLDADGGTLPVSMNEVMFATFGLAYVDIAYRIGNWLRAQDIDWPSAMVLVSGQSGRPTAGVTWASNNMCNLIWRSSGGALPAQRLYVAPHAPAFSVEQAADVGSLAALEQGYRRLWCHTRASVEVSRRMFEGQGAYEFAPNSAESMPAIATANDRHACVARLRRIMEDPQQLLSNCVADYVVEQLQTNGNRPEEVQIPGFANVDYPDLVRDE